MSLTYFNRVIWSSRGSSIKFLNNYEFCRISPDYNLVFIYCFNVFSYVLPGLSHSAFTYRKVDRL